MLHTRNKCDTIFCLLEITGAICTTDVQRRRRCHAPPQPHFVSVANWLHIYPSSAIVSAISSWKKPTIDASAYRISPRSWMFFISWRRLNFISHLVLPLKLSGSPFRYVSRRMSVLFCKSTPETGAPLERCWQNHFEQALSTKFNLAWQIMQNFLLANAGDSLTKTASDIF